MKINKIGETSITHARPFLIAEAGVNHEGSRAKALEMIDAAAEAGADMIKFQSYKAGTLAMKKSPAYWDIGKETATSQYELFKRHDSFNDDDYIVLSEHCKKKNIQFLSTPFDHHFVEFLNPLISVYKIASADITNYPLLRQIAGKNKPILLSIGASFLSEVEEAIRLLQENGVQQIALLHCILEYPTQPQNANLLNIKFLQSVFPDFTIGWSDHIKPDHGCLSLIAAWMQGAEILEKHFTLDKTLPGNDHYHSMDPDDIRAFRIQQATVQEMLGQRNKTVFECEKIPRKYARRSLVAACDIPMGTILAEDMITCKRPGTGISPQFMNLIIGRKAVRDIAEDSFIRWEELIH